MDISRDIHTDLLLKHGQVQASPQHAALLNKQPVTKFVSAVDPEPVTAGYQVKLTGYAEFIRLRESTMATSQEMDNLLRGLRSMPRPPSAKILKGSVSTFMLANESYRVDYRVASGEVVVYNIQLINKFQMQRDRLEKPALYRVARNRQGVWQVSGKVEKIATDYAAVNGQSNNLTKATWLMASHLEYEFKALQEYTLFHNPSVGVGGDSWESLRDKMGFTTPVTRKFAKVLAAAQEQGASTQWVAHSQGGVIFSEGVRYLLNGSSSSAFHKLQLNGIRNLDKGVLLNKHSVVFHGNANNNVRSKLLLDRAGIKVLAIRANDYDLVPNILGANTFNPRKLIGSVVYVNHVLSGSVAQSPHTLAQTQAQWKRNMDTGPGKGRNLVQKGFHKADAGVNKVVKSVANYLP
jgi:hypothetical protein